MPVNSRDIKKLSRSKARKVTVKDGIPNSRDGKNGDITIRNTTNGIQLYAKVNGMWYGTPLTKVAGAIKRTLQGQKIIEGGGQAHKIARKKGLGGLATNKAGGKVDESAKLSKTKGVTTRASALDNTVKHDRNGSVVLTNKIITANSPNLNLLNAVAGNAASYFSVLYFTKSPATGKTAIANNDVIGAVVFSGDDSNTTDGSVIYGSITLKATDVTDGALDSEMKIRTLLNNDDKDITIAGGNITAPGDIGMAGDLTVSGNKITFGNGSVIENETDGDILAFTTEDGYKFIGGNADNEPLNLYLQADMTSPAHTAKWLLLVDSSTGVMSFRNFADGSSYSNSQVLTLAPNASGTTSTSVGVGGTLTIGEDVKLNATKKLILDDNGTDHTYIVESSDDVMDIYVGGDNVMKITEAGEYIGFPAGIKSVRSGYNGCITALKILPSDFVANSDAGRGHSWVTASQGLRVNHSNDELYAIVDIPFGFSATHVQVNASSGLVVGVWECTIAGATPVDKVSGIGSPACNALLDITDVASTTSNYLLISVTTTATSDLVYGGSVKLTAT